MRYRRFSSRHLGASGAGVDLVWSRTVLVAPVAWRPPVDLCETASAVSVAVELAGVTDDDLEVTLYPDGLVVEGVRRLSTCPPDGVYQRAEIRPGPFRLAVPVPVPVDVDAARMRYERGILEVELPKGGRANER